MSTVRQRQPVVARRRKLTRAERAYEAEAQERFKREVLRLDGHKCIGATAFGADHHCTGPLEAHHCVKQQWLRTYVSTLGWTENQITNFLWHPDVGVTLCDGLHGQQTTRIPEPVPLEWLPARVIDFCDTHRIRHLLEQEHPPFADGD